jgi:DNA repair protein RadC
VADASQADRDLTTRLRRALEMIDVRVLDHFVIGDGKPFSFAQRGWL